MPLIALAVSAAAAGGLLAGRLRRAVRYAPRAGGRTLTVSGGYPLLTELPRATGAGPAILVAGPLAARIATWVGAHQPAVVAVAVSMLGLPALALTVKGSAYPGPAGADRIGPPAA